MHKAQSTMIFQCPPMQVGVVPTQFCMSCRSAPTDTFASQRQPKPYLCVKSRKFRHLARMSLSLSCAPTILKPVDVAGVAFRFVLFYFFCFVLFCFVVFLNFELRLQKLLCSCAGGHRRMGQFWIWKVCLFSSVPNVHLAVAAQHVACSMEHLLCF